MSNGLRGQQRPLNYSQDTYGRIQMMFEESIGSNGQKSYQGLEGLSKEVCRLPRGHANRQTIWCCYTEVVLDNSMNKNQEERRQELKNSPYYAYKTRN